MFIKKFQELMRKTNIFLWEIMKINAKLRKENVKLWKLIKHKVDQNFQLTFSYFHLGITHE